MAFRLPARRIPLVSHHSPPSLRDAIVANRLSSPSSLRLLISNNRSSQSRHDALQPRRSPYSNLKKESVKLQLLVCMILFFTALIGVCGAIAHHKFKIGGAESFLTFCLFLYWLKMENLKQLVLFFLLLATSFFFGASVSPVLNIIVEVHASVIISLLATIVLVFGFFFLAVLVRNIRVVMNINIKFMFIFLPVAFTFYSMFFNEGFSIVFHIPCSAVSITLIYVSAPILWIVCFFIVGRWKWKLPIWIPLQVHVVAALNFFYHYNLAITMGYYIGVISCFDLLDIHGYNALLKHYEGSILPVDLAFLFVKALITSCKEYFLYIGFKVVCSRLFWDFVDAVFCIIEYYFGKVAIVCYQIKDASNMFLEILVKQFFDVKRRIDKLLCLMLYTGAICGLVYQFLGKIGGGKN